jgi:hypothetical protein
VNRTDRIVRARIYELFVAGRTEIDAAAVASVTGYSIEVATRSMQRLEDENRLVLNDATVWMAHPFSGVDTGYSASVGHKTWWANCAWDALAVLALLGDGKAHCPGGPTWTVQDGTVTPDGYVHLVVPASSFWDDIGFT